MAPERRPSTLTGLLLAAALLLPASLPVRAGTPGEVGIGSPLRDAPLRALAGESKRLADYRGKPLIINVWASWCGPCRAEMGALERLARRFGGREFNVIGISTDDDGRAAAAFLRQAGVSFPNYLDDRQLLENMLGADHIPLTLLIAPDGRVLRKVSGSRAWDSPDAVRFIGAVFGLKLPN